MRVVIQRVKNASVRTQDSTSQIGKGFLVFVAATHTDTEKDAEYLAKKVSNLRIMADKDRKMNLTLAEEKGEILVVSQFTLYSRTRKGNRPSFIDAAAEDQAKKLYHTFLDRLKQYGLPLKTGSFGEYMEVSLVNDGPVTIIIDSKDRQLTRRNPTVDN